MEIQALFASYSVDFCWKVRRFLLESAWISKGKYQENLKKSAT